MKKLWRKVIPLLIAMTFALAGGVTAGAASITTSSVEGKTTVVTNSTKVTISNVPNGYDTTGSTVSTADDLTYTTYQVIYATYDSTTNVVTWHLTDWAKAALVDTTLNAASGGKYPSEAEALAAISAMTDKKGSTGESASEQNTIVNTLAAYIADSSNTVIATANSFESGSTWTGWTTSNGASTATSTATLEAGSYLVIASASDMSFLNMLVSVDVSGTTTSGSTAASGWEITAKDAVLKGTSLSVEKTVSDSATGTYADSASAQVGDTLYYSIKVTVPQFAVDNSTHTFVVTDTATNLAIDVDSVVVTGYKTGDTTGTTLTAYNEATDETSNASTAGYLASVTNSGSTYTLTVSFTNYYNNTNVFYTTDSSNVTTYNYDYVIISYEATLLSSAAVVSDSSTTGNSNTAALEYDNNSGTSTVSDGATVYTYGLNLTKYNDGTGDDQSALSNATFQIYYYETVGETTTKYYLTVSGSNGTYTVTGSVAESSASSATTKITTYTSADESIKGYLSLTGLDADKTYYIEETTAPSGYTLNTDTLAFRITDYDDTTGADGIIDLLSLAEYSGTVTSEGNNTVVYAWTDASTGDNEITANSGSSATDNRTWSAARRSDDLSGSTTYDGYLNASVTDTKIAALPATGSIGIIVFTIAGVAIMILALILINGGKSKEKAGQGMGR